MATPYLMGYVLHLVIETADVLENHANSVYLLLSKEPSYGNRKLLEARGVTPVVIPEASADRENTYYNRYFKLFESLKEPIERNPLEWGEIEWTAKERVYLGDKKDRADLFLGYIGKMAEIKKSYPGWVVAPTSVRNRLRAQANSIPSSFTDIEVLSVIEEKTSEEAVAIFSLYAWLQNVLLEPLDDNVAIKALRALSDFNGKEIDGEVFSGSEVFKKLGICNRGSFRKYWEELAKGLLHWSRQSLRSGDIKEIINVINNAGSLSSELSDHIVHEKLLRHLYQGEIDQASSLVRGWEPSSSDPFFLVLKSSVLAETGDPKQAISLCNDSIQKLRKMQRSSPKDHVLMSKEAWACFVCHNIQKSINFLFSIGSVNSGADSDSLIEELDKRLTALSQNGYDCHLILTEVLSDLNSEASANSDEKIVSYDFDLGSVSTKRKIGGTLEHEKKITAAFQWLELTERVGLIPRIGNVTFYLDSYLQAAWWTQYNDTIERMLSILIRTKNSNAIKPKDHSLPQYKSGWLSRGQVARIPVEVCEEICDRLLIQVEESASKQQSKRIVELNGFHMEVFSRLAMRLSNCFNAQDLMARLVKLYCSPMVTNNMAHELWKALMSAISRLIESMPASEQVLAVKELVKIPLIPNVKIGPPFDRFWFNPATINFNVKVDSSVGLGPQVVSHMDKLLEIISHSKGGDHNDALLTKMAWYRIYWLKELGCSTQQYEERVANVLWRDGESWPVAPGFHPYATFNWIPEKVKNPSLLFKVYCLKYEIEGFLSSSAVQESIEGRGNSWKFPADNQAFILWIESLRMNDWRQEDADLIIDKIYGWWSREGDKIKRDIERFSNLRGATLARFNYIDLIFHLIFRSKEVDRGVFLNKIEYFMNEVPNEFAPFWRIKMTIRHTLEDWERYGTIKEELLRAIMSGDDDKEAVAFFSLKESLPMVSYEEFVMYANAASSMLVSKSLPSILGGLKLIVEFLKSDLPLSDYQVFMIRSGLSDLKVSLSYGGRGGEGRILDSAIPLLRYYCFSASFLLSYKLEGTCSESIEKSWLGEAEEDPLPEIKHKRYAREESSDDN